MAHACRGQTRAAVADDGRRPGRAVPTRTRCWTRNVEEVTSPVAAVGTAGGRGGPIRRQERDELGDGLPDRVRRRLVSRCVAVTSRECTELAEELDGREHLIRRGAMHTTVEWCPHDVTPPRRGTAPRTAAGHRRHPAEGARPQAAVARALSARPPLLARPDNAQDCQASAAGGASVVSTAVSGAAVGVIRSQRLPARSRNTAYRPWGSLRGSVRNSTPAAVMAW